MVTGRKAFTTGGTERSGHGGDAAEEVHHGQLEGARHGGGKGLDCMGHEVHEGWPRCEGLHHGGTEVHRDAALVWRDAAGFTTGKRKRTGSGSHGGAISTVEVEFRFYKAGGRDTADGC